MLGFYDYTVIATYMSVISAVCGICFAGAGRPDIAVYCLLASGLLDMFDGPIARTKKRCEDAMRFGIQIDSFSDFLAFGVLPAMIMLASWEYCGFALPGVYRVLAVASAAAVVLAALIRLAFFNVCEETRQNEEGGKRTEFQGMPVTTVALTFPAAWIIGSLFGSALPVVLTVIMLLSAVLFISRVRFKKPGKAGIVVMSVVGLAELLALIFGERIASGLSAVLPFVR